ncbi:hypothetical protein FS837_005558 [Tulasnella sp. UAMH 9824]|nr:hypothetical protein FS837_005558 [Tulasnella sp. UAMH 9824]
MVSPLALFVIVSVPIILGFGISAYYFATYRRTRSRPDRSAPDHELPLQLPSSQNRCYYDSNFRLDSILILSPLTFPPRARRRSSSSPPLLHSSASSYATVPSPFIPPAAASQERQIAGPDKPPSPHHALPADYDREDDASLYLHYWPQTPSTASQSSDAFSPATSPDNTALLSYHHGMRQAALTGLRRTTQTPTLDFGSLPTFDISSASPSHVGVGPPKTAPLPRPNSSSSSTTMATPVASRSPPYENPFANPSPMQQPPSAPAQLDYFNCKPLPPPSAHQHPYRCKVSSPLCHSPYSYTSRGQQPQHSSHLGSYFSPAVTPAPLQVLTRPSSPILSPAGFIPPTPDDLFPYISYESSSPAAIVPLPTPPPSSDPTTASFSTTPTPTKTSNLLDVKIYFSATQDLVKIRLPKQASLEDLKSKAGDRIKGGWKGLWVAKGGVDTREPSGVMTSDLDQLEEDKQWRSWLETAARSGSGKQRRIVLWAV